MKAVQLCAEPAGPGVGRGRDAHGHGADGI
jgi:hypothetical protein